MIHKIKLNGPDGIMTIEESLDVTEATEYELDSFLIGLYDPLTGLLYMGAGAN